MQKLKYRLIGFGFSWMFLWSVFGSLLGAKINQLISKNVNTDWLLSTQKQILVSAHAHMNTMAITCILCGLSLPALKQQISLSLLNRICWIQIISLFCFGGGLCLEAILPPNQGDLSYASPITALGGIGYMSCLAIWGVLFLYKAFQKGSL